ncbi:major facilitator superfamily domain-containing protein [Dendryphion nanum]|uniref:Major facilitator superfamily domain-containing protein n=1 Tax=Dendryphion nanum TaxID=256645 RepID=A0A9P9DVW8_9PLEO|nr:major facilitator superfamily domain-containing protein [Dendryphion nanum]
MPTKWPFRKRSDIPSSVSNERPKQDEKRTNGSKKWSLGILADPHTDEVPGSVILLSKSHKRNEPLGLQHTHARTSASSLPSPYGRRAQSPAHGSRSSRHSSRSRRPEVKRTKDGRFILEPQPEDSANDPLNWSMLRRDFALVSLGFYCMIGGGMTPILAAGFNNVAETYDVSVPQVALTTGLYMLGLGLGSIFASPTAILWGKRPVYLAAIIIFMLSSIWCALSPNYISLVIARIVMGFAVSPVECLPSATVAEIFFLHERAYRLGIYTLLLLGGKNLIPLVSAVIIQSLGWRWVFWVVAMVVGFCFFLILLFVPETFWDRSPNPRSAEHHHHSFHLPGHKKTTGQMTGVKAEENDVPSASAPFPLEEPQQPPKASRVGFAVDSDMPGDISRPESQTAKYDSSSQDIPWAKPNSTTGSNIDSDVEKTAVTSPGSQTSAPGASANHIDSDQMSIQYTDYYREAPAKSYVHSLKPWNGRLVKDKWFKVAVRPFVLFAYPAVLWSSMVYALAVGWLIVLSESVAHIYQDRESYNFTSLQVGLVYVSPFVGGVLGTAVAGKISDLVVRFMARRNDGVYEPEFRLIMAIPIALSTTIGLMGFGWSAEEKDAWIVPTVFFGVISFGCSLASTTAVTFCVDSYRVYAGEALVTLNVCKNILHGFVFSLFFPHWLESSGSKDVFLAIGGIQLGCMLFSIPMYIYGKRARMWTVRKNFMEKF